MDLPEVIVMTDGITLEQKATFRPGQDVHAIVGISAPNDKETKKTLVELMFLAHPRFDKVTIMDGEGRNMVANYENTVTGDKSTIEAIWEGDHYRYTF